MTETEDERTDPQRSNGEDVEEKDEPVDEPWETQDQPHEGEEGQDIV